MILFDLRLPRAVMAMVTGIGLALSGCVIQSVLGNPLADPGLLGITSSAGLMVILYVVLIGAGSFLSYFTLPFLALIGGLAAAVLILLLTRRRDGVFHTTSLILTGVAVQAGISAATTILVIKLDDSQYDFIASWQSGSIWGSSWYHIAAILPWLLVLLPYLFAHSRTLDLLELGEDTAAGLGLRVSKERRNMLIAAVALAASCVSISGPIGFVGLIAPHLARKLVGSRHRVLLPVCALAGASLVTAADILARLVVQPSEIPTGIVVACIGAPYFLYLLARSK